MTEYRIKQLTQRIVQLDDGITRCLVKLEESVKDLANSVEELREDVDYLLAEATKIDPLSDRVETLEEAVGLYRAHKD